MNFAMRAPAGADLDPRQVYRTEFDCVWRLLIRLGVPRSDLEDLAHEIFLVVLKRWDSYDRARPIRPWLFGIAYRIVSDSRRRHSRGPEESAEVPATSALGTPESEFAAAQARALLQEALNSLDIERRAAFVMHDIDGCTAPEISESLEIPLNTVYSRLRRAREDLAHAVRRLRRGES